MTALVSPSPLAAPFESLRADVESRVGFTTLVVTLHHRGRTITVRFESAAAPRVPGGHEPARVSVPLDDGWTVGSLTLLDARRRAYDRLAVAELMSVAATHAPALAR